MSELINRQNYEDVREFLVYQLEVRQLDESTARSEWSRLRHLLEWSGPLPLGRCRKNKVTLPAYLESMTTRGGRRFSASHLAAIFKTARMFMRWARQAKRRRYHDVDDIYLESWRPSRARREEATYHERVLYTVDEAIRLATWPGRSLADRRTSAAAALLFISGMRVGAMMTLPISCVDLPGMRVLQLPERGVQTKNTKAAITPLLDVAELLEVCREWDALVRSRLSPEAYWFAHLDPFGELTTAAPTGKRENRRIDYARDLRELCRLAGVEYKSPHKLRHGFAVYALKRAKTMEELKAISQALMHSTIGITDGIYGRLVDDDVHRVVTGLRRDMTSPNPQPLPWEGRGGEGESLQAMIEEAVRKAMATGN